MDEQGPDVCLDCGVPVSPEDWRCDTCVDKVLVSMGVTESVANKLRSKSIKCDILGYDYSDLPELPSLARDRRIADPYKELREYWNANVIQPIFEEWLKEAKKRGLINE